MLVNELDRITAQYRWLHGAIAASNARQIAVAVKCMPNGAASRLAKSPVPRHGHRDAEGSQTNLAQFLRAQRDTLLRASRHRRIEARRNATSESNTSAARLKHSNSALLSTVVLSSPLLLETFDTPPSHCCAVCSSVSSPVAIGAAIDAEFRVVAFTCA